MKNIYGILVLAFILFSCSDSSVITVINNSDISRTEEAVIIDRNVLENKIGNIPSGKVPVLLIDNNTEHPSQVDDFDKDGTWDELFFLISLDPNAKKSLYVNFVDADNVTKYEKRTNIRFGNINNPYNELNDEIRLSSSESEIISAKYQMEGPGWENDYVAYRNYYDARNGIDIFGKRTSEMVLDSIGIKGQDYHAMDEWGMDVLKVGNSLGAGAIAFRINDSIYRLGPSCHGTYELISDGPLRAIFNLNYFDWEVEGEKYDVKNEISIYAGTNFYQSIIRIHGVENNNVSLVTGIVNKHSDSLIVKSISDSYILLATHANQTVNEKFLGMAILAKKSDFIEFTEAPGGGEGITETYLVDLQISNEKPARFYFYSGWELQDDRYSDVDYFLNTIIEDANEMHKPVIIE